jgi:hypothetical protein
MNLFKSKKKELGYKRLDYKSKAIAVMYLGKAKFRLEKELSSGNRMGEDEIFTANHDIKCLENAIKYLSL